MKPLKNFRSILKKIHPRKFAKIINKVHIILIATSRIREDREDDWIH
jgi:hypothetical protein